MKMTMRRKVFNIIVFLAFWLELPRPSNRTVTAVITFAIFLIPGIIGLGIAITRALF